MASCTSYETGIEYEVVLGQSMLGQPTNFEFSEMRYEFKPASAGRDGTGVYTLSGQQVTLELPNATDGGAPVVFQGHHETSRDGHDCVAIFDGDTFTIEQITGQVTSLRHVRGATQTAPTARAALPPPEKAASLPFRSESSPSYPVLESFPEATPSASSPVVYTAGIDAEGLRPKSADGDKSSSSSSDGDSSSSSSSSSSDSEADEGVSLEGSDGGGNGIVGPAQELSELERQFWGGGLPGHAHVGAENMAPVDNVRTESGVSTKGGNGEEGGAGLIRRVDSRTGILVQVEDI